MKVILDTEKLRDINPFPGLFGNIAWGRCCDKAEAIGTPVAKIVEKLRAALPYKSTTEIWSDKCNGWVDCCDTLKRILEGKP